MIPANRKVIARSHALIHTLYRKKTIHWLYYSNWPDMGTEKISCLVLDRETDVCGACPEHLIVSSRLHIDIILSKYGWIRYEFHSPA